MATTAKTATTKKTPGKAPAKTASRPGDAPRSAAAKKLAAKAESGDPAPTVKPPATTPAGGKSVSKADVLSATPIPPADPADTNTEALPLEIDPVPCDTLSLLHAAKYAMVDGSDMRSHPLFVFLEAWHRSEGHPYGFEHCRQQPCYGAVQVANCAPQRRVAV